MKSKRQDGRGHWPRGRPRNDCGLNSAELHALIARVHRLLDYAGWADGQSGLPRVSIRNLAASCGVGDRTARKWLGHATVPSAEAVAAIVAWLGRHAALERDAIAAEDRNSGGSSAAPEAAEEPFGAD